VIAPLVRPGRGVVRSPGEHSGGHRGRDPVRGAQQLRVAGVAQRLSAGKTVLRLPRQMGRDGTVDALHNGCGTRSGSRRSAKPEPSAALVDSQSVRAAEPSLAAAADTTVAEDQWTQAAYRHRYHRAAAVVLSPQPPCRTATAAGGYCGDQLLLPPHQPGLGPTPATPDNSSTGPTTSCTWPCHCPQARRAGRFQVHHRDGGRTHAELDQPLPTHRADYERLPVHHAAFVQWSMIIVMGRRLARQNLTVTSGQSSARCQQRRQTTISAVASGPRIARPPTTADRYVPWPEPTRRLSASVSPSRPRIQAAMCPDDIAPH